jgi:FdhD protein
VTRRCPGADFDRAAGGLFTEGIILSPEAIEAMTYCVEGKEEQAYNVIRVALRPWVMVDTGRLGRNFYTTSSCGVCGKTSLEAVRVQVQHSPGGKGLRIPPDVITALPEALGRRQTLFHQTGGIHAAWLCTPEGSLLSVREDVGRHNALDKLIGEQFLARRIPLSQQVLVLSGRASFEMVQKAAVAGIPVVVAVGAPSSLAVDLARELEMTLVGFTKRASFNIYSGAERIALPVAAR